jgi:hypothetical protein
MNIYTSMTAAAGVEVDQRVLAAPLESAHS